MAKYLKDVMFGIQKSNRKDELSDEEKAISKYCWLIEEIYNFYLPSKMEIGSNIWRFKIYLTPDKALDNTTEELGLCRDYYIYLEDSFLSAKNNYEAKLTLLKILSKGINHCCDIYKYSFDEFNLIEEKIINDGIIFNNYFESKKVSPDRKHTGQMRGYLSENYDERKVFLDVTDNNGNVNSFLIGNYYFRAFDRVKWHDTNIVFVYHINPIQSYKRKKVAEDYYAVDIRTGFVTYHPVTRESIFEYGVKLLTENSSYELAIQLIIQAKEMGHGKAVNILKNLEINPALRDKKLLLQQPKQK
ncbi:hypothetical protein [Sporocytophaga myxococcoides]|uniref:hypothetical protein n=1 Tax=Sporocytophaga myxococcoides TaxID=153721 RepID=UPI0012DF75E1|nr:hypothetical protein [Sporocytophaga myxococcoides]